MAIPGIRRGPKGDQGEVGPAGPAGPLGPVGPEGPQGIQGVVGPAGPVGPVGPEGPQGLAGDVGENGLSAYDVWLGQGNVGDVNAYLASLKGAKGDQGDPGAVGPIGPQGDVGPAGPQGPDGLPGGLRLFSIPGYWISSGPGGSVAATANRLYTMPIFLPGGENYDRIGTWLTAVSAGSSIRFGIRAAGAGGNLIGASLLDCGSVDTSVGAGSSKDVAFPVSGITPGGIWTPAAGLWWLDCLVRAGTPSLVMGGGIGLTARADTNGQSAGGFAAQAADSVALAPGAFQFGIGTVVRVALRRSA